MLSASCPTRNAVNVIIRPVDCESPGKHACILTNLSADLILYYKRHHSKKNYDILKTFIVQFN